jgi:hypothetical protein
MPRGKGFPNSQFPIPNANLAAPTIPAAFPNSAGRICNPAREVGKTRFSISACNAGKKN